MGRAPSEVALTLACMLMAVTDSSEKSAEGLRALLSTTPPWLATGAAYAEPRAAARAAALKALGFRV